MLSPRRALVLMLALATLLVGTSLPTKQAQAQDTWQFHLAQANSFYRNKLLPKALAELKIVVADPEGGKQIKAWQLIIEISNRLKDLDTLIWALEKGRELAQGQEAAQMQAQLYRLKRVYGRVVFEATGGSGKLPKKGIKLKLLGEIADPEANGYFEKARLAFGQDGFALGSSYLPAGEYQLDGEPLKIVAGKDTIVEVAPTTEITFAIGVAGVGGLRAGDTTTGASGFLGGLDVGVGPHIQFASGTSLVIQAGPIAMFGAQATTDVRQDAYTADQRARLSIGGTLTVGFEFRIGTVDISPRVGYAVHWLPSGMYYRGQVVSKPDGAVASVLEGDFIVPAIAHGPRLGVQALLTPGIVKGKRRPRLFVGVHGGPIWANPLWGEVADGADVDGDSGSQIRLAGDDTSRTFINGPFTVRSISDAEANKAKAFVDVQAVVGVQVRL